jgi:hypothetical protein
MIRAKTEELKHIPWFAKAGAACGIVPISRFVGPNIFALKGGGYGCLFSLSGLDEEGLTDLELESRVRSIEGSLRGLPEGSWADYKTGEGIEPDLWAQFPLLEEALTALGVVVWPMVEFEADDALAAAAFAAEKDSTVDRVVISTAQAFQLDSFTIFSSGRSIFRRVPFAPVATL